MSGLTTLTHKFVTRIPETLEAGVMYVSVEFATVVHACCCGCGAEVVTPLAPHQWKLLFDGETISLKPSIGNWNFPCQSHYWITHNTVEWAAHWSDEMIAAGRARDARERGRYFGDHNPADVDNTTPTPTPAPSPWRCLWQRLGKWFSQFL